MRSNRSWTRRLWGHFGHNSGRPHQLYILCNWFSKQHATGSTAGSHLTTALICLIYQPEGAPLSGFRACILNRGEPQTLGCPNRLSKLHMRLVWRLTSTSLSKLVQAVKLLACIQECPVRVSARMTCLTFVVVFLTPLRANIGILPWNRPRQFISYSFQFHRTYPSPIQFDAQ
jgi:hypothetical protein